MQTRTLSFCQVVCPVCCAERGLIRLCVHSSALLKLHHACWGPACRVLSCVLLPCANIYLIDIQPLQCIGCWGQIVTHGRAEGVANYKGVPFMTTAGPVTASIPNAHVA